MPNQTMPEGTDSIIDGAGVGDGGGNRATAASSAGTSGGSTAFTNLGGTGNSVTGGENDASTGFTGSASSGASGSFKDKLNEKAQGFTGQASDKARAYAVQGKDKATESLDGVAKLIEDAAAQIDEKVGAQFGDYTRQAATLVSGFSSTLRDKDVDELFDQARDFVRKSPAIAIGAATAVGFVLARLAKAGVEAGAQAAGEASRPQGDDGTFKADPALGGSKPSAPSVG